MVDKNLVQHPSHYNKNGRKECWEEMREIFGDDAVIVFDCLNAYKYAYRAGDKEGNSKEQDLKKIEQYINHAKSLVKAHTGLQALSVFAKIKAQLIGIVDSEV